MENRNCISCGHCLKVVYTTQQVLCGLRPSACNMVPFEHATRCKSYDENNGNNIEEVKTMTKKIKCNVCEHEFEAKANKHYISRDNGKTGFAASLGAHDEDKIFDTFDCPECGCQVIAQERKRDFVPYVSVEDNDESKD